MTISETIDRARRIYARDFKSMPLGVALSQSQVNDLRVDKIGRSSWTSSPEGAAYKGLRIYQFAEGVEAVGPMIFSERVEPLLAAGRIAFPVN